MDEGGFSLVELIIVMAIMAVLVAIIAPNLTKYLGTSKKQTDLKNLDEVHSQVLNCISDAVTQVPEVDIIAGEDGVKVAEYKIEYNSAADTTSVTCGSNGVADFASLLALNFKYTKTSSKMDSTKTVIKVTISGSSQMGYEVSERFDTP